MPGEGECVGVSKEVRQRHVVRRVEPGRDPQALLLRQPLRPLSEVGSRPCSPSSSAAASIADWGMRSSSVRYPRTRRAALLLAADRSATAVPECRQYRPMMHASTTARAKYAASSVCLDLTARRMRRCSHKSLSRASCAASFPVASSPGHRLRVMSLNAARRIRIRRGRSGYGSRPRTPAHASFLASDSTLISLAGNRVVLGPEKTSSGSRPIAGLAAGAAARGLRSCNRRGNAGSAVVSGVPESVVSETAERAAADAGLDPQWNGHGR
jgi:hypothetical protein